MYSPTSADGGEMPLRAPRANRVFGTDEKRIRTKNTVMDKDRHSEEGYAAFRPRTIVPL